MSYSIYFVNKSNLYLEVGFDKKTDARKKLEGIANCFPNESAVGEIWYSNNYLDKKTIYEITYHDRRAHLRYVKSKKVFKNSR